MGLLSWIILGLIAGVLASLLVGGGGGIIVDIVLGIVGALVGGFLASAMGIGDVSGINLERNTLGCRRALPERLMFRRARTGPVRNT